MGIEQVALSEPKKKIIHLCTCYEKLLGASQRRNLTLAELKGDNILDLSLKTLVETRQEQNGQASGF